MLIAWQTFSIALSDSAAEAEWPKNPVAAAMVAPVDARKPRLLKVIFEFLGTKSKSQEGRLVELVVCWN